MKNFKESIAKRIEESKIKRYIQLAIREDFAIFDDLAKAYPDRAKEFEAIKYKQHLEDQIIIQEQAQKLSDIWLQNISEELSQHDKTYLINLSTYGRYIGDFPRLRDRIVKQCRDITISVIRQNFVYYMQEINDNIYVRVNV